MVPQNQIPCQRLNGKSRVANSISWDRIRALQTITRNTTELTPEADVPHLKTPAPAHIISKNHSTLHF